MTASDPDIAWSGDEYGVVWTEHDGLRERIRYTAGTFGCRYFDQAASRRLCRSVLT